MAQELAGTSSDVGCLIDVDVNMVPITGQGHAASGRGKQGTTMILLYGDSTLSTHGTWSYSKRNVLQVCIVLMALTGAVLGTQHLITKMRYLSGADSVHSSELVQLQGDVQGLVSHAATTYRLPQIFQVGGANVVWKVPATVDFFPTWAAGISFRVGDVLRITGGLSGDSLFQVPDASYAGCLRIGLIHYWYFSRGVDTYIQLTEVITYNFIQSSPVECVQGLKFSCTVNPITVPAAPPRPNVNAPARQPKVFEVGGDTATWTIPSSATFYMDWASNISFLVGDVLSFTLSDSTFEVVEVPYTSYEACTTTGWLWYSSASTTYQLTDPGIKYFVANTPQYCIQGMRFTANIYESGTTVTPAGPAPPPSLTPPSPLSPEAPTSSPGGSSPPSPPSPSGTSPPSGSSPSTGSQNVNETSKSKTSVPAIVGGIFGGVAGIAALAGLSTYLCKNCSINMIWNNFHASQTTPPENQKANGEAPMMYSRPKG